MRQADLDREEALKELRELLGKSFSDPSNRARILQTGISNSTINRWINGESEPRAANVRMILEKCDPEYQALLTPLIETLWPTVIAKKEAHAPSFFLATIPSAFYSRVHMTLAETPDSLRYLSICHLVLQQALQQLDPERNGIEITIIHCVPPTPKSQKVSCLRESVALSSKAFPTSNLRTKDLFLGAESLAGYAISSFQTVVNAQGIYYSPFQEESNPASAVAVPILRAGRIGGCLLVEPSQPQFLAPEIYSLIKEYAALVALAFEPETFFERASIRLSMMPPKEVQEQILATFHERKMHLMRSKVIDSTEADVEVIQQIISELATQASQPQKTEHNEAEPTFS